MNSLFVSVATSRVLAQFSARTKAAGEFTSQDKVVNACAEISAARRSYQERGFHNLVAECDKALELLAQGAQEIESELSLRRFAQSFEVEAIGAHRADSGGFEISDDEMSVTQYEKGTNSWRPARRNPRLGLVGAVYFGPLGDVTASRETFLQELVHV